MASNNEPLLEHHHHHKKGVSSEDKWQSVKKAWDMLHAETEGERVFFDHIDIAADGGLSEIGEKEELWKGSRWFSSCLLLVFVLYNIYFILEVDIAIVQGTAIATPADRDYLVSLAVLDKVAPQLLHHVNPKSVIASLEMVCLAICIIILLWDVFCGIFKKDHDKWKAISEVCWIDLPGLSIFSAMKLLGFVVPQKLSYDIKYAWGYDKHTCGGGKLGKTLSLLSIILSRPIFLIIGMDAFLVKYRGASAYIMKDKASFNDVMGGIIFLRQVLGVVNITFTINSRLYRFVFGGEDGIMSERELVRQDVWESFVAYKVFNCGKYGFPKAVALMLTWSDNDFQMLTLNEKAQHH